MATEIDDDLQLIRASPGLLTDLQVALENLLWKRGDLSRVHNLVRSRDLDHVIQLVEPFQGEPQLLDAHLKSLLPAIVEAYLAFLQLPKTKSPSPLTVSLDVAASKLLYTFCKVRGEKIIIGFLNNEPRYLELILTSLEDFMVRGVDVDAAWEKSYILLLWLTHLMLVPFDLSSISAAHQPSDVQHEQISLHPSVPTVARRVLQAGVHYLSSATREQDAAAKMLVRLVTRPDMQKLDLPSIVVSWALAKLLNPSASPNSTLHTFLGPLRFLVGMTVLVDTQQVAELIPSIYSAGQRLMDDAMLAFLSSSAVTKKLVVKLLRNIALLSLKHSFDRLDTFFESSGVLEGTIEYCLQALEDRDTPVRFASSKALSMIVLRLDPDMGHEVVQAVLESFKEDMPKSSSGPDFGAANALRWHGLTLTLAHALFRRSASPHQLPEILNTLLLALSFEQRSAVGVSTGSNVRDAACFGIWSLSRRYTTKELLSVDVSLIGFDFNLHARSIIQVVATQLLLSACFDPSGNIRRGSSAALQELIGRHPDEVSNGISLVQVVDYHAVGLRQRAMVDVARNAADLDSIYREALLAALGKWRGLGSTDTTSREAAAESMGLLCAPQIPEYAMATLENLQEDIVRSKADLEKRHGSLLAISRIVDTKMCQRVNGRTGPDVEDILHLTSIWSLFDQDQALFVNHTPRAIRAELPSAVARLISSLTELSLLCGTDYRDLSPLIPTLSQVVSGLISSSETHVLQVLPRLVKAISRLQSSVLKASSILSLSDCLQKSAHDFLGMTVQGSGRVIVLGAAFPWLHDVYGCDSVNACNLLSRIIKTAPLTEWRSIALQAIDLILQADTLGDDVYQSLVSALDTGLNDYTITERGDVGSLVRTEAVMCVQRMWKSHQQQVDPTSSQLLRGNIIRLALEKMDKVRLRAASCLEQTNPELLRRLVTHSLLYPFAYFLGLFRPLNDDLPAWKRHAILKGSISCAGVGAEGPLRASRMALVDTMIQGSPEMRSSCMSAFTGLLKELIAAGVETQPLLELIAHLLDTMPSVIPLHNPFNWRVLLSSVQKSHYKSNNIPRILAAIEVYQALAEKPAIRADTLKKLASMLGTNPYPTVRTAVCECLFLVTGDQELKRVDGSESQTYNLQVDVR
ncbi:hypothetical protein E4T39_05140 [Aureobasidium subglaciale]|nr:hypothetical protein E4T39_05140 [Aureobasidium subglaciale]